VANKRDFNPSILKSLEELLPKPMNNYGNFIVVEDESIYPLKGSVPSIAPMVFALVPPDIPSTKPPSNIENWVKDSKADQDKRRTQFEIDEVKSNAEESLKNLRSSRDNIDKITKKMSEVPPLVLLINPSTFSHDMSKLIIDGSFTRSGYVREHWGENLDTVSCDGTIGGFYGIQMQGGNLKHQVMITRSHKKASLSFQNLMSLIMIYENNGRVYSDLYDRRRVVLVGSVMMFWDGNVYIGNFNNFTVSDREENPYNTPYSFEFAVSSIIDAYGRGN